MSAFDLAGQRCSALRVLCLQDDVADRMLPMLSGAIAELAVGNPDRPSTDVGPVISDDAHVRLVQHIGAMRVSRHIIEQGKLAPEAQHGLFVPPTIIHIKSVSELKGGVFGPVLHVLAYPRQRLEEVVREINATGFAFTFGVHSRIDETIERVTRASAASNQYVNRTVIGAVVGVQPFGGQGLSGTGPKAGGPLYLLRLLSRRPSGQPMLGEVELVGPVGERNTYGQRPKGMILCVASDPQALQDQVDAARLARNRHTTNEKDPAIRAALFSGNAVALLALGKRLAAREGPVVPLFTTPYPLEFLTDEVLLSVNTAAAGGNASLMTIG